MPFVARLRSLGRGLLGRAHMERELDAELAACLDELAARHQAAGLAPDAARSAALRELGSLPHLKLAVRESWLVSPWDMAAQDLKQAWRGLRATPGLSLLAVTTFALGIGAAAAILAVVQGTLQAPLPYRDAERLVLVWADLTAAGHPRAPLSGPELHDLRTRTASFAGVGAVWANSVTLREGGEALFVRIGRVTGDFFPVLGVAAARGRLLADADAVAGSPAAVLLSHALWQRRFGGDPAVVGRSITVDERQTLVIGVLPADFRLLLPADAGTPDTIEAYQLLGPGLALQPRGQRYLRVVGRLRPGVSLEQARADVDRLAAELTRELPAAQATAFTTVSLPSDTTKEVRGPLAVVIAGVALLLVISAVNVLGVLVARAASRRREVALRVALGAGFVRLLRLSLAEGWILAGAGSLLGIGVARLALQALLALQPDVLRRLGTVALDARVLAACAGLALCWGLLFALAPLREYARADVASLLASTRAGGRPLRPRLRSALVVAQVALTLVLLVGAAVLARTFLGLLAIDPGFRAAGVLTFRVPSAAARDASPQARVALARTLDERLRAVPGVTAVGAASHLPYDSIPNWGGPYTTREGTDEALPSADYRAVSPGFLEAAGVTLLRGRAFTDADGPTSAPVAIVDESLVQKLWPGQSAVGERLRVDPRSSGAPDTWVTVVGVVRHVRHRSLVSALNEQVYFPLSQVFRNPVAYLVRTEGEPAALAPAVRQVVSGVDPRLPVYEVLPLASYLDRARAVQRFTAVLVAAFAAVALALAGIGLYGVIAYLVAQRRREFGVRLALGATRAQIGALVLREGAWLVAGGVGLGLVGAASASALIRASIVGVEAADPLTYSVVVPTLAATALLACAWPAVQATRADVAAVLRVE